MIRKVTFWLAVVVASLSTVHGQQAPRTDVTKLGPQVGDTIPDFRLQDRTGTYWTRDAIMGPKGAMVVFSRSVDWCPFCKTQVVELQGRARDLKARGLGLAIITYDSPEVLADFSRRRGITVPLLSDPGSRTIKAFGILNTTVAEGTPNYGIPFPGTFLVDRQGRVTSRFFEEAFQERNTVATILLKLGQTDAPTTAARIKTDQLEVTTYLSDEVVAPGSLFSLVVEVQPRAGIHVYAPGAAGYRVIAFTPEVNPLVQTRPVAYPASEVYHFKPLDERVPVFQRRFVLTQAMSLKATPEARAALAGVTSMTIKGTLDYQACDDRVCFNPRSLPVSHTVRVRQLDTERVTGSR